MNNATNKGLGSLRQGLGKTSRRLSEGIGNLLLGQKEIDSHLAEDLETALLTADLGLDSTQKVIEATVAGTRRTHLHSKQSLVDALRAALIALLETNARPLRLPSPGQTEDAPFVILFVGVNGSGKTTSIGKLGHYLKQQGYSVLLAAGDTFRAAATEQLQAWGERIGAPVIAQGQGADAASVIFDALSSARARKTDILLADTAGRLQNKTQLMDELAKIGRVIGKFDEKAPHEVLLVLDAGTGRNGLQQIQKFAEALPVSGLVITKLDGTAKGGFVVEASRQTVLPVYFVGLGEGVEDLQSFSSEAYVDALLADIAKCP